MLLVWSSRVTVTWPGQASVRVIVCLPWSVGAPGLAVMPAVGFQASGSAFCVLGRDPWLFPRGPACPAAWPFLLPHCPGLRPLLGWVLFSFPLPWLNSALGADQPGMGPLQLWAGDGGGSGSYCSGTEMLNEALEERSPPSSRGTHSSVHAVPGTAGTKYRVGVGWGWRGQCSVLWPCRACGRLLPTLTRRSMSASWRRPARSARTEEAGRRAEISGAGGVEMLPELCAPCPPA